MLRRITPSSIIVLDCGGIVIFGYPPREKDMFIGSLLNAVMSIASTLGNEEVRAISTEKEKLYIRRLGSKATLIVGFSAEHDEDDVGWIITLLKNDLSEPAENVVEGFVDSDHVKAMEEKYKQFLEELNEVFDLLEKLDKKVHKFVSLAGESARKSFVEHSNGIFKLDDTISINSSTLEAQQMTVSIFKNFVSNLIDYVDQKLRALL